MRIEITPSIWCFFKSVYCNFSQLILNSWEKTLWDEDRLWAKLKRHRNGTEWPDNSLRLDSIHGDSQDNGCGSGQKQRNCTSTTTDSENQFVWQWHSHVNVTEILVNCFWHFLKDLVIGSPLMTNCFFIKMKTSLLCAHTQSGRATPF